MDKWHKVFAGLGACLAALLVVQSVPRQTIVVGRKSQVDIVATSEIDAKRKATPGTQKSQSKKKHATLADATARQQPVAEIVRQSASTTTTSARQGAAPETAAQAEGGVRNETPSIDFGAGALAESGPSAKEQPAAPMAGDPWSPVITRPDGSKYAPEPEDDRPSEPPAAKVEDEQTASALLADPGIPDSHKSVAPILAAHPDRDLILCLAGCGSGTSIVEIRRRPLIVAASTGELVPTSAGGAKPQTGDIVCIAGCVGRPGEVVYRDIRLSWITDEGKSMVKAALRAIADRVVAREGLDIEDFPRNFMSADARLHLSGEGEIPHDPLGFAAPRIAAWMTEQSVAANAR